VHFDNLDPATWFERSEVELAMEETHGWINTVVPDRRAVANCECHEIDIGNV
jgi:hypothetical protein